MALQGDHLVKRDEITGIFTENIKRCLWMWEQYRKYGWPFAGGWIEQPWYVYDIISTCNIEYGKRKKE
jgi:hypothetical protein